MHPHDRSAAARLFLYGGALALALGSLVRRYLRLDYDPYAFFNADALVPHAFVLDVVRGVGDYSDWFLPPAPSIFPDLLLFIGGSYFVEGWFEFHPAFWIVSAGFQVGILTFLYRTRRPIAESAGLACAVVAVTFFLMQAEVEPFSHGLRATYHYGTFVAGILMLALLVRGLDGNRGAVWAALLVVGALTVASDISVMLHFVLPVLAVLCLRAIRCGLDRRELTAGAVIVASTLLGRALYAVSIPNETAYAIRLSFSVIPKNLELLGDILLDQFAAAPWVAVLAAVVYGVLARRFLASAKQRSRSVDDLIAGLAVLSLAGTLCAIIPTKPLPPNSRYLIHVAALPLVLLPLLVDRAAAWQRHVAVSVCVVIAAVQGLGHATQGGGAARPDWIECVEREVARHGGRAGISQYWEAKPLTILSDPPLHVDQFWSDLSTFLWNSSRGGYLDRYDFVVLSKQAEDHFMLDRSLIRRLSGDPLATADCGRVEVWSYAPGSVVLAPLERAGDRVGFDAESRGNEVDADGEIGE